VLPQNVRNTFQKSLVSASRYVAESFRSPSATVREGLATVLDMVVAMTVDHHRHFYHTFVSQSVDNDDDDDHHHHHRHIKHKLVMSYDLQLGGRLVLA
jgi:hypothetical protein